MPNVCRVGLDIVSTGIILGPGASTVFAEGAPVSLVGDKVAPHGKPPHTAPTIVNGSVTVLAQFRPITVLGISKATCMHPASKGSATVFAT